MEQYASFARLVASRHSCRAFEDKPVDRALVRALVDAARLAPSAVNRQPWHFVAIDRYDSDMAEAYGALLKAYDRPWFSTAPMVIVACESHDAAWHRAVDGKDHADIDIAIATEHIMLAAEALGLGACWVCNFDPKPLAEALGLPEGTEPAVIIPVGYPSQNHPMGEYRPASARKPIDEILSWGKY
ncbi:MAG: nitroreductase family protein [Pseudoflavonifractor sp.]|nr:nitroreductase family protein [Pseudoflavonifractor sp.]